MKSRSQRRMGRLPVEVLEDRRLMATWGRPWADPGNVTMSFVPDGTSTLGQPSSLFSMLDSEVGAGQWQTALVRAVQTWASLADVDVGLVADGGQPIGTAGPAQGDPRFGDIRISAAPLSSAVAAIGTPYDPTTGTISGDIILNSNFDFRPGDAGAYDLFTVALHEAGHSFGFADSHDPSSFMYDVYTGPVSGLGPGASAAMQLLYGAPDTSGDTSGSIAKPVAMPAPTDTNPGVSTIAARVNTIGDLDAFKYQPSDKASYASGLDVLVQTGGSSLLTPTVSVFDSAGNMVGSASANGPLDGSVKVHIDNVNPKAPYTILVGGSADVFGVGDYQLTVSPGVASTVAAKLGGAKDISGDARYDGSYPLTAGNVLLSKGQTDLYSFVTPATTQGSMAVQIRTWGVAISAPTLSVLDASGKTLGQVTVTAGLAGSGVVTLSGIQPKTKYFLQVVTPSSSSFGLGTYRLAVNFNSATDSSAMMDVALPSVANIASNALTPTKLTPDSGGSTRVISSVAPGSSALFQVPNPKPPSGVTSYLTVTVLGLDSGGFAPRLSVLDDKGMPAPYRVLSAEGGTYVIQITSVATVPNYTIGVSANGSKGGNFFLGTTSDRTGALPQVVASASLNVAVPIPPPVSLTLDSDELYQFVLTAAGTQGGSVRMVATDAYGNVVAQMIAAAGQSSSQTMILAKGTYSLRFETIPAVGNLIVPLTCVLTGTNLSDPIKAYTSGSSGTSTTTL